MSSPPTRSSALSDDYTLSLALAEWLQTVGYTCPWHPDGTVPAPQSGRPLDARCRVLLFSSGQRCRSRLAPVAPPYAHDLDLASAVLTTLGGSWVPMAGSNGHQVTIRMPHGAESLVRSVDAPEQLARLITERLVAALPAPGKDTHG